MLTELGYKVLSIIDTFLLDVIDRKLMYQDDPLDLSRLDMSANVNLSINEIDEKITLVIRDTLVNAWEEISLNIQQSEQWRKK